MPGLEREIRFAVVMYGGVSLAIYIHGVSQELYKLVRATAKKKGGDPIAYAVELGNSEPNITRSTEQVYREIGKYLNSKFVIDILSGTSAGGINAVYLAKGLVNNQSLDGLKDMWVKEGDLNLLINDKVSGTDLPINLQLQTRTRRPQSLLNSQRMYYKLLEALHKMGADPNEDSHYVQDLDLFVTATDLNGLTQPIHLADEVVYENRYRNVFKFRYATEDRTGARINDFLKKDNPFLAFAARCTSSFPFAFEAMTLADIKSALATSEFKEYENETVQNEWRRFYQEYTRRNVDTVPFEDIPFGDGGYLDNKPFSYATKAAFSRRSDPLVRRKLIYIEPAPEHPDQLAKENRKTRPDAFENTLAALISLPRSETIREEIHSVYERNRLIERIQGILSATLDDVSQYREDSENGAQEDKSQNDEPLEQWRSRGSQWASYSLKESIKHHGPAYGMYHRLRAAQVTDELTTLIARLSGFDEESDQRTAIRYLVQAWRNNHYERNPAPNSSKLSENEFLYKMDVGWRMRRLHFIVQLIDKLANLNGEEKQPALKGTNRLLSEEASNILKFGNQQELTDRDFSEYLRELAGIKASFDEILVRLNYYGRELHFNPSERSDLKFKDESHNRYANSVRQFIGANQPLNIQQTELKTVLESLSQKTLPTSELLNTLLEEKGVQAYLDNLVKMLDNVLAISRDDCDRVLNSSTHEGTIGQLIRNSLKYYFEHYDFFDQVTFPILYGTPAGESDLLEVIRISPEEVVGPVNQHIKKGEKLKGTKFGNFGAFFKEQWRVSDMVWGRLDGAERLITTLLPSASDAEYRKEKIEQAHAAILREELIHLAGGPRKLQDYQLMTDDEILAVFSNTTPPDSELPPRLILNWASRSIQILGNLLDGLSDKYTALKSPSKWIFRLGQFSWSLVEMATPDSFGNIFSRHWLTIFYLAESLLILGGLLLRKPDVTTLGLGLLIPTILLHLLTFWISGFLQSKRKLAMLLDILKQAPFFIIAAGLLILIYIGARHFKTDLLEPLLETLNGMWIRIRN